MDKRSGLDYKGSVWRMRMLSTQPAVLGAWISAVYRGWAEYNLGDAVFDDYEALIQAAKVATLLSSCSHVVEVSPEKFDAYRKLAQLKPMECRSAVTDLATLGVVRVDWSSYLPSDSVIRSFSTVNSEPEEIMSDVAKYFAHLRPSRACEILLEILGLTVKYPNTELEIKERLCGAGYDEPTVTRVIDHLAEFQLVSRTQNTERGSPLLYNPATFKQQSATTVHNILSKLDITAQSEMLGLIDFVQKNPGVPLGPEWREETVNALVKCGLLDMSSLKGRGSNDGKTFPTTPYLWGAFSNGELSADAIDDAKVLLNSLRFGQYYSSAARGRIQDPEVLLDALISRGHIGPATAIGQDYPLPLSRGIVSIAESRIHPQLYDMQLLKTDVAKNVLRVMTSGHAGITDASAAIAVKQLSQQGTYTSPDTVRTVTSLPSSLGNIQEDLAFTLRTHRGSR